MKRLPRALMIGLVAYFTSAPAHLHAQTAAVLNPPVTVGECPGWSDIYGTLIDSGVGCANHQVTISDGTHGTMVLAPTLFGAANSPAILNYTPSQPLYFARGVARSATDIADFEFARTADYTGGTTGFVNGSVRIIDTVSPGINAYEWSATMIMDNSATAADGSENVAGYAQARKHSTGKTWAGVSEIWDYLANPSTSTVAHEFDLRVTGTDNVGGGDRVGIDLFGTSLDGNPAVARHGFRINTDANTTFTNGFEFQGATITNAAIGLADTQKICFDGITCANYMAHSSSALRYHTAAGDMAVFGDTGTTNLGFLTALSGNFTAGPVEIASGQKACFDGTTCANYISQTGGDIEIVSTTKVGVGTFTALGISTGSGAISGGAITGTSLSAGSGTITGGAFSSASETSTGTIQGATLTSTGNVIVPTNGKFCLNGTTCTAYLTYDGTYVKIFNASTNGFAQDAAGAVYSAQPYRIITTAGVTCSGAPTGSFASNGGIVTHC